MKEKLDYLLKQKLRYNGGEWWINNIDNPCHHINIPNPDITVYTDASLTGWGVTDGISPSREPWHKAEFEHNNVLELKAIKIGIYIYCKNKDFLHVSIMCDNLTAISYGGHEISNLQ